MKKRRIFIIHESSVFQSIIKRTLNAEVPDIDLHVATSAREALDRLAKETFDMVISANEMAYMNGTLIFEMMRSSEKHSKTAFLLVTSKLDEENKKIFKERGIVNVLRWPFKPGELAQEVETLSHPREWRQHRRIFIPETRVLIRMQKKALSAHLVDISMGGMLCDLPVETGLPLFSHFYRINIQFPLHYDSAIVNAQGYVLRQAALQWLEPPKPEIVQIAWRFTPYSSTDSEIMNETFEKAFQDLDESEKELMMTSLPHIH